MSTIKIFDLRPAGSELFHDSESFLNELTEEQMYVIEGGRRLISVGVINVNASNNIQASFIANTVFSANGNTINANTIGGANTAVG